MALTPVPATPSNIAMAGKALRRGELVAFPTETVYGLGADAGNGTAVAQIYATKGRPAFNPLIVHVSRKAAVEEIAHLTPAAQLLGEVFWPGGLTMVLDRRDDARLCDLVSAGLPSIAIRVPSHPVALDLLRAADCPVAAPSANLSGHVSTTSAAHVASDIGDAEALAMILDDGPCQHGIESTIIDARGETPILLRPGAITLEDIAIVLDRSIADLTHRNIETTDRSSSEQPRSSPGQLESHYAPSKPVFLNVTAPARGQAWLTFGARPDAHMGEEINLSPTGDLIEASANLFAALRALDRSDAKAIAIMPIPDVGLGLAINDRLRRAAAPR